MSARSLTLDELTQSVFGWRDSLKHLTDHGVQSVWRVWDIYFRGVFFRIKNGF